MKDKLIEMHGYEEKRDASPKIRGFLFQDLVALDELLDNKNEYILLEWIEDVCCKTKNGMTVIQAKYYPESNLQYSKIYKELFCDYLMFDIDGIECECQLALHAKDNIDDFTKDEIEDFFKCKDIPEDSVKNDTLLLKKKLKCLSKNNYEDTVIENIANKTKLKEFCTKVKNSNKKRLSEYMEELVEKIMSDCNTRDEDENFGKALLGTALLYIQESYFEESKFLEHRIRRKGELVERLRPIIDNEEQQIWMIVYEYINECIGEILDDPTVDDAACEKYRNIFITTIKYLKERFLDKEERFRFINTVTLEKYKKVNKNDYITYTQSKELKIFFKSYQQIISYFKNVWKILFDIGCKDFSQYINENIKYILAYNFPKEIENTAVLSSVELGRENESLRRIFERIKNIDEEKLPSKWYLRGKERGIKSYQWDVTDITSDSNTIEIIESDKRFFIECLDCLHINDEMGKSEECDECIFAGVCNYNNKEKGLICK
ncbi:hypothetical protein KYB31_03895 [Clostridium felsineum]|uniref:hypothetical protein n=1 Tax=Clostridium felsineum TaxID=36839 RepID=UPI00214DDC31|nr:hypothetical protein [Clostridium felsineum]MCR3758139.1 hypothetical protein [Clostridium felsineum]